jgi:Kef-type K+ transport system membrane component KefB
VIALGFAGTIFTVTSLAVILKQTGNHRSSLYDALGRMIFSFGFALDVVAVIFGLISVLLGGHGRRLGLVAMSLVLLSFLLLFAT